MASRSVMREEAEDGWNIDKVASFLGLSKGTLYVYSCHDLWGGGYPPAPRRVRGRLRWVPREVIDYRDRVCAVTRKQVVYAK